MNKKEGKTEIIKAFRHALGAKKAFTDMVQGRITREEFENKGYHLAKLA